MQLDMRTLPWALKYKIVNSTITPRPIAWVSTLSADGVPNLAPHSFFNAVGDDPPLVVLGLLRHHLTGAMKDTAANIMATGEFVASLVSEADAEAMSETSVDAPASVDEIAYAGVEVVPSELVKPARVASSPVNFECRKVAALDIGRQTVILGEILMTHIKDEFIIDRDRLHLDTPAMRLIARTHGAGWYSRTRDQFKIDRPTFDPVRAGLPQPDED